MLVKEEMSLCWKFYCTLKGVFFVEICSLFYLHDLLKRSLGRRTELCCSSRSRFCRYTGFWTQQQPPCPVRASPPSSGLGLGGFLEERRDRSLAARIPATRRQKRRAEKTKQQHHRQHTTIKQMYDIFSRRFLTTLP